MVGVRRVGVRGAIAITVAATVCWIFFLDIGAYAHGESNLSGVEAGTGGAVPIFGLKIPAGYRDWKLVSVAHEEGNLNDLRAILGNDIAIQAYRSGTLPFPDGAVIVRLAWSYTPSDENNRAFGKTQSFVSGDPTPSHLQFMVKDSKKYAGTGGWGFAQFDKDGHPAGEASLKACFPCHKPASDRDFVFTRYSP
jgi:hypothetical protein